MVGVRWFGVRKGGKRWENIPDGIWLISFGAGGC